MEKYQTIKLRLEGKVQGVFLRETIKNKVKSFMVTGTIKNQANGSVEIIIQGGQEQLNKVVSWLKNKPLPTAEIIIKRIEPIKQHLEFRDFRILW